MTIYDRISCRRILDRNYLLLPLPVQEDVSSCAYPVRMLLTGTIPGLLPCRLRHLDGSSCLTCDITGLLPLSFLLESAHPEMPPVRPLLLSLFGILSGLADYLLDRNGLLLHPSVLYLDRASGDLFCAYDPFPEQADPCYSTPDLIRYLMEHMPENREEEILLLHRLYFLTRYDHASPEALLSELMPSGSGASRPLSADRSLPDSDCSLSSANGLLQAAGRSLPAADSSFLPADRSLLSANDPLPAAERAIPSSDVPLHTAEYSRPAEDPALPSRGLPSSYETPDLPPSSRKKETSLRRLPAGKQKKEASPSGISASKGNALPHLLLSGTAALLILYLLMRAVFDRNLRAGAAAIGLLSLLAALLFLPKLLHGKAVFAKAFPAVLGKHAAASGKHASSGKHAAAPASGPRIRPAVPPAAAASARVSPPAGPGRSVCLSSFPSAAGSAVSTEECPPSSNETTVINTSSGLSRAKLVPDKAALPVIPLFRNSIDIGKQARTGSYVIPDPAVSRLHARIIRENGTYYLEDMNSRNGTFINGVPAEPGCRKALKNGDRIRFAACHYTFQMEE